MALVRRGGLGLGTLLALAALVTVGAVVRLTVLARREEIEIMKLVGATAAFIRGPFVLGAAAQGLAGGGLAAGALHLTHRLAWRSEAFQANPFMTLVAGRPLPGDALALLAVGGALLGLVAALLSLRRAGTF
jgi:cell division transport system permease protein